MPSAPWSHYIGIIPSTTTTISILIVIIASCIVVPIISSSVVVVGNLDRGAHDGIAQTNLNITLGLMFDQCLLIHGKLGGIVLEGRILVGSRCCCSRGAVVVVVTRRRGRFYREMVSLVRRRVAGQTVAAAAKSADHSTVRRSRRSMQCPFPRGGFALRRVPVHLNTDN